MKKIKLIKSKKRHFFEIFKCFLMPVLEKAKIQFLIPPFSFYTIYLSLLIYPIRNTPTECIFSIAGSIIFLCCKNMSINFDISKKVLNGVNIYMYKPRFSETLFCMFLFDKGKVSDFFILLNLGWQPWFMYKLMLKFFRSIFNLIFRKINELANLIL